MNKTIHILKWIVAFVIIPVVTIVGFFGILVLAETYGTPVFNAIFNLIF